MIKSVHLRKEGWAHNTSLTPPLFIETSVPLKPAKWAGMYLCVKIIDFDYFYDFDI